ncbi:MAG: TetR/AcrR family transcriptional regulator [Planctomycetaceae bacterium]
MTPSTTRLYRQTARAESAAATGRRIIEAFLERLREQWYDEITLDCVAADAGVTVQTVVRRFGGKAGLLAEAVQVMIRLGKERRATVPGDLDQLVKHLIDDYEHLGDTIIRLLALEDRHPVLKEQLELGRRKHRNWVAKAFADDLSALEPKARQVVLDALVVATDVYVWKLLRRDMARSIAATEATMKHMIRSAVAANLALEGAPGDKSIGSLS